MSMNQLTTTTTTTCYYPKMKNHSLDVLGLSLSLDITTSPT